MLTTESTGSLCVPLLAPFVPSEVGGETLSLNDFDDGIQGPGVLTLTEPENRFFSDS